MLQLSTSLDGTSFVITSTRRVDEGGHLYYHDGKCIMDLSGWYDNNVRLFCDCSSSIKVDGTRYDGKYCEAPVEIRCGGSNERFYVNDGRCD